MFRERTANALANAPRGSETNDNTMPRRRGRTRLWDGLLTPREPMHPQPPTSLIDSLIAHFLHPVRSMRAQLERGEGGRDAPWKLWAALAAIAVLGSLLYGASITLALPAGSLAYAALALAASAAAGWVLFGGVLLGLTRQPAPHLAHACMVAMMFGEAVLELGVLANVLLRDFDGALALNIGVVALSNLVMLILLAAQLRVLGIRPALTATLWFAILNPAGIAAFRLFYPELFPF